MAFLLLLPLILVPVVEIALFIEVGQLIGLWPTVLAIFATGLLGLVLMRTQGLDTLRRAQAAMERREFPARELFDGFCILIGGALLVLPGFMTDAVGLLFLLPPVRGLMRHALRYRVAVQGSGGWRQEAETPPRRGDGRNPWAAGPVIEGEYREVAPDEPDRAGAARHRPAGRDGDGERR